MKAYSLKAIICIFLVSVVCTNINRNKKLKADTVMAHRGVWGYFPEHSIRGFELAYFMGTDYLETDVNMTKDGVLIIHHDAYLDDVTDVNDYPQFQNRRKSEVVDGLLIKDKFFVSDFTFEEIQMLFLKQRNPLRPQLYNKEYKIMKLETLIEMTIRNNLSPNKKKVGIYIEPKSIDYYKRLGFDLNANVVELLRHYQILNSDSYDYRKCPIVIQSFEYETLVYFRSNTNLPQVALMRWRQFYNMTELAEVSDGFGPDIDFVLYERIDDKLIANGTTFYDVDSFKEKVVSQPFKESVESLGNRILSKSDNEFVKYANSLGKHVQVWNMNNDSPKFSLDPVIEYAKIASLGVDAFFSDFCDTALFSIKHYKKLIETVQKEDEGIKFIS